MKPLWQYEWIGLVPSILAIAFFLALIALDVLL